MSVSPIDLQVLFSKAADLSENIARSSNATQTGQVASYEKIHRESNDINRMVNNVEQYSQEFSKINPEGSNKEKQNMPREKNKKSALTTPKMEENKKALKEEGTGNIIDILD